MNELPARLRPNAADVAVTVVAAGLSLVPVAGGFFAVLGTQVIPGQWRERISEYCSQLSQRVRRLQEITSSMGDRVDALEQALAQLAHSLSAEQVELFKEGANEATGATTNERIAQIAQAVSVGLNDDAEALRMRELLSLVGQLTDAEIVVLCAFTDAYAMKPDWKARHLETLGLPPEGSGWLVSSAETEKLSVYHQNRVDHLVALGLLNVKTQPVIETNANYSMRDIRDLSDALKILKIELRKERPRISRLGTRLLKMTGLLD